MTIDQGQITNLVTKGPCTHIPGRDFARLFVVPVSDEEQDVLFVSMFEALAGMMISGCVCEGPVNYESTVQTIGPLRAGMGMVPKRPTLVGGYSEIVHERCRWKDIALRHTGSPIHEVCI